MKICKEHWAMFRAAIETKGMVTLVAVDGAAAIERIVDEIEGGDQKKNFDPLMSMNWHWMNRALENGGLYLLSEPQDGQNDGHYCPICEFKTHSTGFDPATEIEKVADQMAEWCRAEHLIPMVT